MSSGLLKAPRLPRFVSLGILFKLFPKSNLINFEPFKLETKPNQLLSSFTNVIAKGLDAFVMVVNKFIDGVVSFKSPLQKSHSKPVAVLSEVLIIVKISPGQTVSGIMKLAVGHWANN